MAQNQVDASIQLKNANFAPSSKGVTNGDTHDHLGGDGGTIAYSSLSGTPTNREVLTAARTYYVRTDGSDSNNGLANTAGGAFLTIQKAVDTITTLDINGQTTTIQIADGTYTGAVTLKNVEGNSIPGNLVIQGNNGTPANVHINVTGNAFISINVGCTWDIKDMKITATSFSMLAQRAFLRFSNINFAASGIHILGTFGGDIQAIGNYAVSGNATNHLYADATATVNTSNVTVTFSNSPVFTTFATSSVGGIISSINMAFTNGGTVTGKRYDVASNGVILTNGGGANFYPGNVAGTTATGGQYV